MKPPALAGGRSLARLGIPATSDIHVHSWVYRKHSKIVPPPTFTPQSSPHIFEALNTHALVFKREAVRDHISRVAIDFDQRTINFDYKDAQSGQTNLAFNEVMSVMVGAVRAEAVQDILHHYEHGDLYTLRTAASSAQDGNINVSLTCHNPDFFSAAMYGFGLHDKLWLHHDGNPPPYPYADPSRGAVPKSQADAQQTRAQP